MSLVPTKPIYIETAIPAGQLVSLLSSHVDTGKGETEKPEYKGIVGNGGFRLKYLLKPSYVEGCIIDRAYGSDIDAVVSLPPAYGLLIAFSYLSLAFAVFLSSGLIFGVLRFHKAITLANLIGAGMYYMPALISYLLFAASLRQAHRWNELFFEDLVENLSNDQQ